MAEVQVIERKLAVIFAADIAEYSRLMGLDEVGTLRRRQRRTQLQGTDQPGARKLRKANELISTALTAIGGAMKPFPRLPRRLVVKTNCI